MQLLTAAHPEEPELDMAVSHALLRRVAAGELSETARVFRPGPTLAFGRLDTRNEGFARAREAAVAHGFTPLVRLGGGQAAAYDQDSVVVELATRTVAITAGVHERFEAGTALLAAALAAVGVPAEVGELPGEYCPGRWSLHVPGGPKLAGAAQRSIRGASLFTAVVVVAGGDRVRAVLEAVYGALAIAWEPTTAGAAADACPGLSSAAFVEAVVAELGPLAPASLDLATLALARELLPAHRVAAGP